MLNDGLEPDRSPSPKRKRRQKIQPKANGPSATRTSAHAQSMVNKQRNSSPETPEVLNEETELADLEKMMDSFDAEEEKIIGTIVKLDCDGSKGISDSPPRITLNEDAIPVHKIGLDGHEPATTGSNLPLEGVTGSQMSNNDVPSVQNNEVAPPDTVKDIESIKQKISLKSHPITPVTPASVALKGVTLLSHTPQSTKGVTMSTKHSNQLTPANPVLGGVTQITLSDQSSNVSETTAIGTGVTPGNDTHTASQLKLPDLVANWNEHVHPVLPASIQTENSAITPANDGEFDFPALSSEEDTEGKTPTHYPTNGPEQTEVQLMEEEDDAVSALLSLSKLIPSDISQEDLDNSELLPISKWTVDMAPVSIRLGTDDVNREINKLLIPSETKGNNKLSDQRQDMEITTTIIANRDGSVVSTVSEQKINQNRHRHLICQKQQTQPSMKSQVPLEVTFNWGVTNSRRRELKAGNMCANHAMLWRTQFKNWMTTTNDDMNKWCVEPVTSCLTHHFNSPDTCMNITRKPCPVTYVISILPSRVNWTNTKSYTEKHQHLSVWRLTVVTGSSETKTWTSICWRTKKQN